MPRLTDEELGTMAEEIKLLEARITKLQGRVETRKTKVIKEMQRRRLHSEEIEMTDCKVRITKVEGNTTNYIYEAFAELLPRPVFRRITKSVLDTSALSAAVQAGLIEPEVLAAGTTLTPKKPYVVISIVRED